MPKAYKLLRIRDEKLYPLYVNTDEETPIGVWLKAKPGERTKNGKVSEEQSDRLMKLHKLGNFTAVCYGWEEAKDIIEKYIRMPSKEVPLYVQWLKKLFRKKY